MRSLNLPSDVLFIIKALFQDRGAMWFRNDCVSIEGALIGEERAPLAAAHGGAGPHP